MGTSAGVVATLGFLACAGVLYAQEIDVGQVLSLAQASLTRLDPLSLRFEVHSTEHVVSPATGTPPHVGGSTGTILISAGRWRTESSPLAAGVSATRVEVWNGTTYKTLNSNTGVPEANGGSVASVPRNPPADVPLWLLTGKLTHVPSEVAQLSVFEHLLNHGTDLKASTFTEPIPLDRQDISVPAEVVRVTGSVPWGDYELWIDPSKDYAITRLVANLGRIAEDTGTVRYETLSVGLIQVDGIGWIPESCTLLQTDALSANEIEQPDDVVLVSIKEMILTGITPGSGVESVGLFDISWPADIPVGNLDLNPGQGRLDEGQIQELEEFCSRVQDEFGRKPGGNPGSNLQVSAAASSTLLSDSGTRRILPACALCLVAVVALLTGRYYLWHPEHEARDNARSQSVRRREAQ